MKRHHLISAAIIIAFLAFSGMAFRDSLTPYVNFSKAKTLSGNVQVRGVLVSPQISVSGNNKIMEFALQDETGQVADIVYSGIKPDGLEQATSIVVIGKYQRGQFVAERLLIKCPSKYQRQGSVEK